jgi:hypothetical protein
MLQTEYCWLYHNTSVSLFSVMILLPLLLLLLLLLLL